MKKQFLNLATIVALLSAHAETIVLECEQFEEYGGWSVDSQFIDEMGSSYLLAHGLGQAVADASTSFDVCRGGRYGVYARTKNWTGRWSVEQGAGAFRLLVNGVVQGGLLGVHGDGGWLWEKVGDVVLAEGRNTIALHDETGFDGRCDAIVVTSDSAADCDVLRNSQPLPAAQTERYDLVVAGGGIAGICTAISAARLGLKVALVQDRPVLGGANSSEVRVHLGGYQNIGPYPRLGDIVSEIGPAKGGNARPAAQYEDDRKLAAVKAEKNIKLCLGTRIVEVDASQDENGERRILAAVGRNVLTGGRTRLVAPLFADCTGDGCVGFLAGADYRIGRESRSETGEDMAPEAADATTMGASVQWYARMGSAGPSRFPHEPWMISFSEQNCEYGMRGDWDWEIGMGHDQLGDFETVRDYGLLVAYSNWSYVKNYGRRKAEFADAELVWVAYVAGKRETRRLMGDHVLCQQDVFEERPHPDGTCCTTWAIDLHLPMPSDRSHYDGEPFRSICTHNKHRAYQIPYRCFYSRNVSNLFMAGRDISVTHVALGTTRVMRTHGMQGEVVGMAASICKRHDCDPRGVYESYLDELKALMTKGVGAGEPQPPQDYNLGTLVDPPTAVRWQRMPVGVSRKGEVDGIVTFSYKLMPNEPLMNGNLPRMGTHADILFAESRDATDAERIVFEAQGVDVDDRHHEQAVELRPLLKDEEGEVFELMPMPVKMMLSADPRYKGSATEIAAGSWREFTTGNWFSGEAGAASHGLYAVTGADGDKRPTGRLSFLGFRLHVVRDASLPEPNRPVTGTFRLSDVRMAGSEMPFEHPFFFADNLCRRDGRYRFAATVTDDFQARPAHGVDRVFDFRAGERVRLAVPTGLDGVHWIRWSLSEENGTELAAGAFRTQTLGGDGAKGQPVPAGAVFRVEHAGRGVYEKGEPFEMKVEGARGAEVEYVLEPYCSRDVLSEGSVPADGRLSFPRHSGVYAYRLRLERRENGKTLETAEFLFGERSDAAEVHSRPGRMLSRHDLKEHPFNRLTYHLPTWRRGKQDLAWQVADFERLVRETRAWTQNFTVGSDLADFAVLDGVYDFTLLDRFLDAAADWGVKLTLKFDHGDWYAGQYRWQKFSQQYSFDRTVCGQDNPCGVFAATDSALLAFYTAANRAVHDRYSGHVAFQGYYVWQPASEFTVVDQPWVGSISGYSPVEEAGFRDFLRRRYGTIDALNACWRSSYATWEEVHSPLPAFRLGPTPDLRAAWVDFSRWKEAVSDDWYFNLAGAIRAFDTNRVIIAYGVPKMKYAGLLDFCHNGGNACMGERGEYADAWYKGGVGWITEPLHPQRWAADHVPGAGGWTLDASVWTMLAQAGAGGANLHLFSFMDYGEKSHTDLATAQDRMRRYEVLLEEIHDTRLVQPVGEIASYAGCDTMLLKHRAYFIHRLADLRRWLDLISADGFRAASLEAFPGHRFKLVVPNAMDEVVSAEAYSNIVRQVTEFGATCLMTARTGRYVSEFGADEEFPLLKAFGVQPPGGAWTTTGDFHATALDGCPLFAAGGGFDVQTLTKLRREESDASILRDFGSYPYRWLPETDYFGAYVHEKVDGGRVLARFDATGGAALTLHEAGRGRVLVFWGLPAMTGGALKGMMAKAAAFAGVQPSKAEVGDFFELHGDESGRHYGFFFLETTYGERRLVFPNCPDGRFFADDMVADRKYGVFDGAALRERGLKVKWEKGQSPLKAIRLIPMEGKIWGGMYDDVR